MKFLDFYLNEANKQEKEQVQNDNNFLIGAELEFIAKNIINKQKNPDSLDLDIESVAKSMSKYISDKINFSRDSSIRHKESFDDIPIEIITKPYTWKQFEEIIPKCLDFIKKYGYTNDTCGFHITINYGDKELPKNFGDKLTAAMEEKKVYKDFPSRQDNEYATSRQEKDDRKDYHDKYYTFRIRRETNQVEFRILGGEDYEKKWNIIRNLVLDYMVKYKNSLLDPEFMKRKIASQDIRNKMKYIKSQSPEKLFYHARDVIKKRWPEAEPIIMKSPMFSYLYAFFIIKERWPEAEPVIMKDPESAHLYSKNIIKNRWIEAEKYISEDPESAYLYAVNVIKDRFPQAEKNIKRNPEFAYEYTEKIIKKRWPEAEPFIMKNPEYIYYYAKNIIKGAWHEAELHLERDSYYYYNLYKKFILNKRKSK